MITLAICGCGNRGLYAYTQYSEEHPERLQVVAGADIRPERLRLLQERYHVPPEMCFASAEQLLAEPRLADALLIATQDRTHVAIALRALELGYQLILEKPISPELTECLALLEKVRESGNYVTVCHVLRYSPFYRGIKRLLEEQTIGTVKTIAMTENVGYWHYCHSFVRGNWRRSEETSPMILAKSCHDMDLFRWLAGERCRHVQSFGSLSFFHPGHKPEGAGNRCTECRLADICAFSAKRIYLTDTRTGVFHKGDSWPVQVLAERPDEASVLAAIQSGPYGRCVFACDNDVVDHQTVNMEFEGDIYGTFTMSAFTDDSYRTIKITGTAGEIYGRMDTLRVTLRRFGEAERVISLGTASEEDTGHGGGDIGLAADFCDLLEGKRAQPLTSVEASVESHVMALAAEQSRLQGGRTVELAEFQKSADCQ